MLPPIIIVGLLQTNIIVILVKKCYIPLAHCELVSFRELCGKGGDTIHNQPPMVCVCGRGGGEGGKRVSTVVTVMMSLYVYVCMHASYDNI